MGKLLETIIENHDPNWQDLQVILGISSSYEEQRTALAKAKGKAEKIQPQDTKQEVQINIFQPSVLDGTLTIKHRGV